MFKSIVYSFITRGTVGLINFLILIISSRYLGVSSRGEISIFVLNITIIQMINEVYTGYSIVHFIPKFNFKKLLITGLVYTFLFTTTSNIIILVLNKQVSGYEWLGFFISLLVILNTFNCVLLLGKENIRAYNLLSFLQPLLLLIGIVFCVGVLKIFTFDAYVFPLLFSFAMAIIISSIMVLRFLNSSKEKEVFDFKSIIVKGFMFQAAALMFIFANRYSYYLLYDKAKVGLYSSASSLMESVLVITGSIAPVLLTRVANQNNPSGNAEITLSLAKVSILFSLVVLLILYLIPDSLFVLLLGNGFTGIKHFMLLYSPGIIATSFFGIISNYFSATGRQKIVLMSYSAGFVITLLFAPTFIKQFDLEGAAYIADLSYFVMGITICSLFVVINKISFKRFLFFYKDYQNIRNLIRSK
jgi:O-antigen/teichoic acid export membrane protein